MLFTSVGGYMLKNTEAIICFILFFHQFSYRSNGSYIYSRPISIKFNSKFKINK